MPARARAGPTSASSSSDDSSQIESSKRLQFDQLLVGCSSSQLLERLQTLHHELAKSDQDSFYIPSLDRVQKDLIKDTVIGSNDKAVKAYMACVFADLLRLYAPDAPWSELQLTTIFEFFFRQLKNLVAIKTSCLDQYYYVLKSIATVKSCALICTLPAADDLMLEAFQVLLDIARPHTPRHIAMYITEILTTLIDEMNSIPSEVVDHILKHFDPQFAREKPQAHQIVVEICNQMSSKLSRYVCQNYKETLDASKDVDDDIEEDSEETPLGRRKIAHGVIRSVNKSCPSLLANVIPELDMEFLLDEVKSRVLAVETVGRIFSAHPAMVDQYPQAWKAFLGRTKDKSSAVRVATMEVATTLLLRQSSQSTDARDTLISKLEDPDDKVRTVVCQAFEKLDYETTLRHVESDILHFLAERLRDRKSSVQLATLRSLTNLFTKAYPELSDSESGSGPTTLFGWIPGEILKSLHAVGVDVRPHYEEAIFEHIFPLPSDATALTSWVDRYLNISKTLDEVAQASLFKLSHLLPESQVYHKHLSACERMEKNVDVPGVIRDVTATAKTIAKTMTDPEMASEILIQTAKSDKRKLYRLLQSSVDPNITLKDIIEVKSAFKSKLEDTSASVAQIFHTFFRRCAYNLVNQSSIPVLLDRLTSSEPDDADKKRISTSAFQTLRMISKGTPLMIKPASQLIVRTIESTADTYSCEAALYSISKLLAHQKDSLAIEESLKNRLYQLLNGSQRQINLASKILGIVDPSADLVQDLVTKLEVSSTISEQCRCLRALCSLSKVVPVLYATQSETVKAITTKFIEARFSDEGQGRYEDGLSDPWEAYDDEKDVVALAIKAMANECLSFDDSDGHAKMKSFLELAWSILDPVGSINTEQAQPPDLGAIVRLQTALSVLKVATVANSDRLVFRGFKYLAWTMQDPSWKVRSRLLNKLLQMLKFSRLRNLRFNVLLFLTIHDPDKSHTEKARHYMAARVPRASNDHSSLQFEGLFVVFLHLLAHHPDFSLEVDDLKLFVDYIKFYLQCLAARENISLLYNLAAKLKSVRDGDPNPRNENLYAISELAQHLIKAYVESHRWTLESNEMKFKLPQDLVKPLPNAEIQQKILKRSFLPQGTLEEVLNFGKTEAKRKNVRAMAEEPEAVAQEKKIRKRRKKSDDEDYE